MIPMLNAVTDYAKRNGAKVVEGYPIEPQGTLRPPAGCTGVASAFRKAGFVKIGERAERKPIMRHIINRR